MLVALLVICCWCLYVFSATWKKIVIVTFVYVEQTSKILVGSKFGWDIFFWKSSYIICFLFIYPFAGYETLYQTEIFPDSVVFRKYFIGLSGYETISDKHLVNLQQFFNVVFASINSHVSRHLFIGIFFKKLMIDFKLKCCIILNCR